MAICKNCGGFTFSHSICSTCRRKILIEEIKDIMKKISKQTIVSVDDKEYPLSPREEGINSGLNWSLSIISSAVGLKKGRGRPKKIK